VRGDDGEVFSGRSHGRPGRRGTRRAVRGGRRWIFQRQEPRPTGPTRRAAAVRWGRRSSFQRQKPRPAGPTRCAGNGGEVVSGRSHGWPGRRGARRGSKPRHNGLGFGRTTPGGERDSRGLGQGREKPPWPERWPKTPAAVRRVAF
jgi:hypothetical protein